jgi:acyl-coenzyme A synthetase/AMP-(fatty) acid ligase/thioesterase domain-containing protein/acyl carrier protein
MGYLRLAGRLIKLLWAPGILRRAIRRNRGHAFEEFSIIQGDRFLSREHTFSLLDEFVGAFRDAGVRPSHHVAVCMPLCPEYLICVLSLLKLGCVVIPLNQGTGADRLNMILDESQADVLVTDVQRAGVKRPILALEDRRAWSGRPLSIPARSALTRAILIFTSGTTGSPKCGIVDVAWLFSRVSFYARTLHLICTQPQWVTFNNVYAAVMFGGTVVLPELDDDKPFLERVIRLLDAYECTVMTCTPSFLDTLLDAYQQPIRSVRVLLLQGELITPAFLRRVEGFVDLEAVVSMYGATELSVVLEGRYDPAAGEMTFLPVPGLDQDVCILDDDYKRVGPNTTGTIAVELGSRDARRTRSVYFNDTQNYSSHRLVKDGRTCYLTVGDLGYRDERGRFHLVGRNDRVVKINGQRLDLTDIECAVEGACGGSVRCSVHYFDERFLVGFVNREVPLSRIRAQLSTLPEYAIPRYLIHLPTFPLNGNHKVDVGAMYSAFRDTLRETLQESYVAPRNDLETRLALMWARHFCIERIGVKDSFFDLGGSSLLAMRLLAEIREDFGIEIHPGRLVEAQTIEALAAVIHSGDPRAGTGATQGIVALRPGGEGAPLFCVHPTGGDITCYGELSRHLEPRCPVYGIQHIHSSQDAELSIEQLAELHTKAVRTIQARGPYQLCGWSMGGLLALEMASQLEEQGEEVAWIGLIDTLALEGGSARTSSVEHRAGHRAERYELLRRVGVIDAVVAEHQILSETEFKAGIEADDWPEFLFALLNGSGPLRGRWFDLAVFEKWISVVLSHLDAQLTYVPRRVKAPLVFIKCPANQSVWSGHSSGSVHVHDVDSDHMRVISAPAARHVAEVVNGYLLERGKADGRAASGTAGLALTT